MGQGYVDIYLLPVRADRLDEYREQAMTFGAIVKEYGGIADMSAMRYGGFETFVNPERHGRRRSARADP
jgi:uncharacterized protein YbaA (DUF1428 family)